MISITETLRLVEEREIWRSPVFPVLPHQWLRITLKVRGSGSSGYLALVGVDPEAKWGRELGSSHGSLVASDFSELGGEAEWQEHVWFSRVLPHASGGMIRLENGKGTLEVRGLQVEPVDAVVVAAWASGKMAKLPSLPRVRHEWNTAGSVLKQGAQGKAELRVLMLGDSAMNDLGHAPLAPLWEQRQLFEKRSCRMELYFAVGAGTGPKQWMDPATCPEKDLDWEQAVVEVKPDVIFLGGISTQRAWDQLEKLILKIQLEVKDREGKSPGLVLVTPFPKLPDSQAFLKESWVKASASLLQECCILKTLAQKHQTGLMDLNEFWRLQMLAEKDDPASPEKWYRDPWHVGTQGRLLLAQVLLQYVRGKRSWWNCLFG